MHGILQHERRAVAHVEAAELQLAGAADHKGAVNVDLAVAVIEQAALVELEGARGENGAHRGILHRIREVVGVAHRHRALARDALQHRQHVLGCRQGVVVGHLRLVLGRQRVVGRTRLGDGRLVVNRHLGLLG